MASGAVQLGIHISTLIRTLELKEDGEYVDVSIQISETSFWLYSFKDSVGLVKGLLFKFVESLT